MHGTAGGAFGGGDDGDAARVEVLIVIESVVYIRLAKGYTE